MKQPVVRDAKRGDILDLAGLMSELGYPVEPEVLWSRVERMASEGHRTFVAEVDGRVAGFAGCSALAHYGGDASVCWVAALSVSSHFRRHGVGRILIEAIERWAIENGMDEIRVNTAEPRVDAHAFYEACGFRRAGYRFKKSLS